MKPITPELSELLHRTDPAAGPMAEIQAIVNKDAIRTKGRWNEADSLTGFTVFDSGEISLTRSGSIVIQRATPNTNLANIDSRDGSALMARVTWGSLADPEVLELHDFQARVHPRINGGSPLEVIWWELRVWSVQERLNDDTGIINLALVELTDPLNPLRILETGSVEHEIVFDFSTLAYRITPKRYKASTHANGVPTTVFEVRPVKADGSTAANAVWMADDTISEVSSGGNILDVALVSTNVIVGDTDQGSVLLQAQSKVPICIIRTGSVGASTITFSTNPLDVGTASGVEKEFIALAITPPGTSVLFEVETSHGSGTWTAFVDGDTTTELGIYSSVRTLFRVRITLTPDSGNFVSPLVTQVGVFSRTIFDIADVADISGVPANADVVNMQSEVVNPVLTLRKTGERDFADIGSVLFSANYIGNLLVRIYTGSILLDKKLWMHYDDFKIRNIVSTDSAIVVECISLLDLLKRRLPREVDVGGGSIEREALIYTAQTPKAVYDDLLDQMLVPNSQRGPGVEDVDANHVVTYTIRGMTANERLTSIDFDNLPGEDGQRMLEAMGFIAGGVVGTSQGAIKFFPIHSSDRPIKLLPYAEIRESSPGYSSRLPLFFVMHDYNPDTGEYAKEIRSFHNPALQNLGEVGSGNPAYCPEHVQRWIPASPASGGVSILASFVAQRQTRAFGAGVMSWRIDSPVPHPELETGDRVAFPISHHVDRDPNADRALLGRLWAVGRIHSCLDFSGTAWQVLVSYADLLDSQQAITRLGFTNFIDPRNIRWQNEIDLLVDSLTGSGLGSFSAAQSVDSDLSTVAFNVDSASSGAYVQAQFAVARELTGLWFYMQAAGSTSEWRIRYSDNGSSWTTVPGTVNFFPKNPGWNARRWLASGSHVYWRVELLNTPGASPDIMQVTFQDEGDPDISRPTDDNFPIAPHLLDPIGASVNADNRWTGDLEGDQDLIGGTFHVESGEDIEIGAKAATSYWQKTIRVSAAVLVGETDADAGDYTGDQGGLLHTAGTVARNYVGAIPLIPQGAEIVAVRFRGYREGTADLAQCVFQRIADDGGRTVIATLTHGTTGYATTPASVSEVVGGFPYSIYVNLDNNTTPAAADAVFVWFEIDYRITKVRQGL